MNELAYPRPQLQRSNWLSLNGQWDFIHDDERIHGQPSDIKEWNRTIEVPYAPESSRSGIRDTGFHPGLLVSAAGTVSRPGKGRLSCISELLITKRMSG